MDYEKKYNEALERAKKVLLDKETTNHNVAEFIFPELRESEDFDEEVRKWLVGYFSSIKDTVWIHRNTITCEQILEWLEKQKELMPPVNIDPCDASWDAYYQRGLNKGYELGLEAGRKEQKPISQDNFDKAKHEALWGEQKPELVQQPPITFTYNSNASRDERLKAALLALLNSDLLKIKEGGYFTKQDLIDWVERIPTEKPAEWSEEDEKMIERLITRLNWITYNTRTDGTSPNITFFDEIDWLKSLRPSWKPSEEQMDRLFSIVAALRKDYCDDMADFLASLYEQLKKL